MPSAYAPGPWLTCTRRVAGLHALWCSRGDTLCDEMLKFPSDLYAQMLAHCLRGLPDEACGLLGGLPDTGQVERCYLTRNAAASAKLYSVEPAEHLAADRDAERSGMEIIGVFHSHTHTEAFPSPTDVAQAPDPGWHYVLVSLRDACPVVRSYRILGTTVEEEPVVVQGTVVWSATTRSPVAGAMAADST